MLPLQAILSVAVAMLTGSACIRSQAPEGIDAAAPSPAGVPGLAHFSSSNAWTEVEAFVKLGPKPAFSPEAAAAAAHIETRLKTHGLEPSIDVFTDMTPLGPRIFRNVTAELPGREGVVVLVSHYDTKSGISTNFVGANDSASSTGLLLELARCLSVSKKELPTGVIFAFVDGEECLQTYGSQDGLHGSRRLAARMKERGNEVKGAIVLDMIGDKDLTVTIPRNSSASLMNLAFRAAHAAGVRQHFEIGQASVLDDHVPFLLAGIRAVDLIDFQYGSAPGANDYWHTPADTLDKISISSLDAVGKVVLHMIAMLKHADSGRNP